MVQTNYSNPTQILSCNDGSPLASEAYLVVFIVVTNLVGIDAEVSKIGKFSSCATSVLKCLMRIDAYLNKF